MPEKVDKRIQHINIPDYYIEWQKTPKMDKVLQELYTDPILITLLILCGGWILIALIF